MRVFKILVLAVILFSFNLVSSVSQDFSLNTPLVKTSIKSGDSFSFPVGIVNNGNRQQFSVSFSPRTFDASPEYFILDKGSSREFYISLSNSSIGPGVYISLLNISDRSSSQIVPIILEIETSSLKYDVSTEIPPSFSQISPGGDFSPRFTVYNFGLGQGSVSLSYKISDFNGNLIASYLEDVSVKDSVTFTRTFHIPEIASDGNYIVSVIATSGDSVGTSVSTFTVGKNRNITTEAKKSNAIYFAFGIIVLFIVAFLVFNYYWSKRLVANANYWHHRVFDDKKVKYADVEREISRLLYQKILLKKAYDKKYIRKETYEQANKNIELSLAKLRKKRL